MRIRYRWSEEFDRSKAPRKAAREGVVIKPSSHSLNKKLCLSRKIVDKYLSLSKYFKPTNIDIIICFSFGVILATLTTIPRSTPVKPFHFQLCFLTCWREDECFKMFACFSGFTKEKYCRLSTLHQPPSAVLMWTVVAVLISVKIWNILKQFQHKSSVRRQNLLFKMEVLGN